MQNLIDRTYNYTSNPGLTIGSFKPPSQTNFSSPIKRKDNNSNPYNAGAAGIGCLSATSSGSSPKRNLPPFTTGNPSSLEENSGYADNQLLFDSEGRNDSISANA